MEYSGVKQRGGERGEKILCPATLVMAGEDIVVLRTMEGGKNVEVTPGKLRKKEDGKTEEMK